MFPISFKELNYFDILPNLQKLTNAHQILASMEFAWTISISLCVIVHLDIVATTVKLVIYWIIDVKQKFTCTFKWKSILKFLFWLSLQYRKHRHQWCKAPSLCKTFFITNNCRLKEAGQKKYLSHNVFLSKPFSHRFSHFDFLTTAYSQRLFNIFLLILPLHIRPHNVVLTTSQ